MEKPVKRDGAHVVTKTLADGSKRQYHYAWRGGPAIKAEPGTEAYAAELANLTQAQHAPIEPIEPKGKTLEHIIDGYLDSPEFAKRADRTRQDYRRLLAFVVSIDKYRNMPLALLDEELKARQHLLDLRDQVAKRSFRQADYIWTVLNIVLNWARVKGQIRSNPCTRIGVEKLYEADRKNKVWTDTQIAAFKAVASPELSLAMDLAFWTAQRQGDLLDLTWDQYDGDVISLTQNKTDVEVVVPVSAQLKAVLDATPRRHDRVLVNQDGAPWSADGFRVMWAKTCHKAKVANSAAGGVTFHDLRGTSASRMGQAYCTTIEIASITGHGLESRSARSSLDGYVMRDISLARSAIGRFEAYEKAKSESVNQTGIIDLFEAGKRRFTKKSQ